MNQEVHSFDIFDTCITRIWAKPADLFLELGFLLQREQLIKISPEGWQILRIDAEKTARNLAQNGEVTIQEIYQQLSQSTGWTNKQLQKAVIKEIELEFQSLYPLHKIKQKIALARSQNRRIVYISDMYLSEDTIISLLAKNSIWHSNDKLYVSSQWRMNKATGALFNLCLNQENIEPTFLKHTGDNYYTDIKVPNKLGIQTTFCREAHLNRYEEKIANHSDLSPKFRSLLAGSSRLTRLSAPEIDTNHTTIWNTSANVSAPVLFGFVQWCLKQAHQKGIERLYFVARDGQILLKIAKIICKNWGYKMDCRYLYGSRQAWHFPSIIQIGETELDWILDDTEFLSIQSICERVNIFPKQIENCLQSFGFNELSWNKNLSSGQRTLFKQVLSQDVVRSLITSTAADYRQETLGYFRQEGLDSSIRFAIVDIGWHGRLQCSLRKILDSDNSTHQDGLIGFYFALSKRVKAAPNEQLFAYFSDPDHPSSRDILCQFRALFELFVTADHGGTMNFKKTYGQYMPVLKYKQNKRALNWGLRTQQIAICQFSEYLSTHLTCEEQYQQDYLIASEILLDAFIFTPSLKEAKVYGSFEFAEDQAENIVYELAPRYRFKDYLKLLSHREHPHHNVWVPAAKLRSPKIIAWLIRIDRLVPIDQFKQLINRLKKCFLF